MICAESTAPDHPDLKVTYLGGLCKPRKTFCFTRLSDEMDYSVYDVNIHTLERAIKERVFFVCKDGKYSEPYRPQWKEFNALLIGFKVLMRKLAQYTTPLKALAFAESYQGRRRAAYLRAALKNQLFGFDDRSAIIRAFVKLEKYNFTLKLGPVPRLIQPRDDRFLVETGRYIKPIEKKVYKGIDTIFGERTVYKGLNMRDRGNALYKQWCNFRDPVAIGLDASRFDQHVSNVALEWEHSIYEMFYPGDPFFKRLMRLQRDNHCRAYTQDGSVSYRTKHNRMSGDSNTSLGNVLIMCASVYSLKEMLQIEFSLANDGDDCVIICERGDEWKIRKAVKGHFRALGFTMTVEETVDEFEKIEFCQAHPVFDKYGGYTMVRDPRTSISKDAVALKPLDNPSVARKWMAAVGLGGLSLTSGMPVLQAYYSYYIRHSQGADPLSDPTLEGGFFRLGVGMEAKRTPVSPESRCSFWVAFGIPPQSQMALEEYYDQLGFGTGDVGQRFAVLPISDH